MTGQRELFARPKPPTCRKCGAVIRFIVSRKGNRIPCETDSTTVVTAEGDVITGYVSHFATCPGAEEMRGTGRQAPGRRARQAEIHDMIAEGLGDFIQRHDDGSDDDGR